LQIAAAASAEFAAREETHADTEQSTNLQSLICVEADSAYTISGFALSIFIFAAGNASGAILVVQPY
jgi:hypothetical protein